MLKCPVCDFDITEQEEVCPNCGNPNCGNNLKLQQITIVAPSEVAPTSTSQAVELPKEVTTSTSVLIESASKELIPTTSKAKIILKRSGNRTTQTFSIEGEKIIIGRFDPDSGPVDIDLGCLPEAEAEYISRYHAEIWQNRLGQYFIKDLDAKNGTFFRPKGQPKFQRVSGEQAINDGDEIALGNVQFEFYVG
ncbi:FHA domain-containing protein [Aerosakkonemataceae cyanobacterium BLCC-F50]|uniref:FHA domain-containing protein n=1 Tax=Floridaenema flaviceps BLCC-F50 TaxID=3153642 RepID=A0ABV4XJ49_9CYAN